MKTDSAFPHGFMSPKDRYYIPLFIVVAADAFVIGFSVILAYFLRFYTHLYEAYPPPPPPYIPNLSAYVLLALFLIVTSTSIFSLLGLYRNRIGLHRESHPLVLIAAIVVSYILVLAALFYIRQFTYSRLTILLSFPITCVGVVAARSVLQNLQLFFIKNGIVFQKTVLIGPENRCAEVVQKLHDHHGSQYQVLGFVSSDSFTHSKYDWLPCLGTYGNLSQIVQQHAIDHIIIAMPPIDHKQILKVIDECRSHHLSYHVIPELYDHLCRKISVSDIDSLPSIIMGESPLYGLSQVVKRLMDIVVATMALIVASPVMIAVALWIKLDSKGGIFYVQERVGTNGKKFKIFKFRSMKTEAEARSGPVWATANDPRTTHIGRFLRRYNLDELPQFYNVLRGDMSLVGPRPERPFFVDRFNAELPLYMRRHLVKTGITGWAQVHGLRGDTSVEDRLAYDLYYVQNWSLLLDIKILLKTLTSFKNAY